ncbi:hypothetical protein vseg_020897 [Gypsophila vaccaria]
MPVFTPDSSQTRPKPAISSRLLTSFSSKGSGLLGFGCTAPPEVTVPGVIRDPDLSNKKKPKKKKKKKKKQQQNAVTMEESLVQDLWCGVDSAASASVDCLHPLPFRHKIDLHKPLHLHLRPQHGSYSSRQRLNTEHFGGPELDSAFDTSHVVPDVFEARYYHHLRNHSPERLAEIVMFQNGLLTRRSSGLDRYRDLRLDVDSMTYEDLLELGERIGHVNTGLGEDQIGRCLRKTKVSAVEVEPKCSICQEEYSGADEMGKLECGHAYHLPCIKQWLARKNTCPVCKAEASSQ